MSSGPGENGAPRSESFTHSPTASPDELESQPGVQRPRRRWGASQTILLLVAVMAAFAIVPSIALTVAEQSAEPRALGRAIGEAILWPLAFTLAAAWAFWRARRMMGGLLLVPVALALLLFVTNLVTAVSEAAARSEGPVAFDAAELEPPARIEVAGELRLCHQTLEFSIPAPEDFAFPEALQEVFDRQSPGEGVTGWAYEDEESGALVILSISQWSELSQEFFLGILAGILEESKERGLVPVSSSEWSDGAGRAAVAFDWDGIAVDQLCRTSLRAGGEMLVVCVQTIATAHDELAFVRDGLEMASCPAAKP